MKHKLKGQFKLNLADLQEVMRTVLKEPEHKDVKMHAYKSPCEFSKSLYIKISIGEFSSILRLSDHECKRSVRQILVQESTGKANVCYKLDKAIKDLRKKRLLGLIKGVNNEFKTN